MKLPKTAATTSSSSKQHKNDQEEERIEDIPKKSKEKTSLSAILSKAPPSFPWLFSSAPGNKQDDGLQSSSRPSPFQLFEKNNVKDTSSAAPNTASTSNQLLQPRCQQIKFKINNNENKNDEEKSMEKPKANSPVPAAADEDRDDRKDNNQSVPDLSIPEKALSGGTLLQRATKDVNASGPFPSTASTTMLSLLEGNAKLGFMTEAHREAALSDWRRKSEKGRKKMALPPDEPDENGPSNSRIFEDDDAMSINVDEDDEFLDVDDQLAKEILADVDKEEAEAIARRKAKKAAKRLKKEKEKTEKKQKQLEDKKKSKTVEKKAKKDSREKGDSSNKKKKKKRHSDEVVRKDRSISRSQSRSRTRRHSSRSYSRSRSRTYSRGRSESPKHRRRMGQNNNSRRSRSNSSSHTYSSGSPVRRKRSPLSPLPPFSRRRAFETRRRLIEESWHRRIEDSIRPYPRGRATTANDISPIRRPAHSDKEGEKPFDKADYVDDQGRIDKQKLREIATRNATKLAMEGKLPKGAELIETIKHKSVEQLIGLCKQLQTEKDLLPKANRNSSSDSDEDRRYSRKYEDWRERKDRSKDREFKNRAVRPAGSDHKRIVERERHEVRIRQENNLRLSFPVSSGVQHRTKANEPIAEGKAGPLVLYGDIGPLTTALAKVRTNLPAAYRPLSQPLPTAQPTSSLSTHFQSTSALVFGPLPSEEKSPSPPPEKKLAPDLTNTKAYEIALAAAARTAEMEKEKTKEPMMATSTNFVGPVMPEVTAMDVIATATITSLGIAEAAANASVITTTCPITAHPPVIVNSQQQTAPEGETTPSVPAQPPPKPNVPMPFSLSAPLVPVMSAAEAVAAAAAELPKKQTFTSSWDKPGHIAAREAFLRKIAEQKKQAEEAAAVEAKARALMEEAQKERQLENEKVAAAVRQSQQQQIQQQTEGEGQSATAPAATHEQQKQEKAAETVAIEPSTSTTPVEVPKDGEASSETSQKLEQPQTKPALQTRMNNAFVPSKSGGPLLLPTTSPVSKPATVSIGARKKEKDKPMPAQGGAPEADGGETQMELIDRMNAYVETQVARQKAESVLQATILSSQLHQQSSVPRNELTTFVANNYRSRDPIGLTQIPKNIQEMVAERSRYSQRLQRDPNDYEARKGLAKVEGEMSKWAFDPSLPGEFTGHTGARVLSEKELEPNDPRFHAWAKKDQFRNAPELSGGVGMRLMQKMGWKPGQGLGKDSVGSVEPLSLDIKSDRKGFFSEDHERVPKRESVLDAAGKNPVSVLMEVCSRNRWHHPEFYCLETGSLNNRRYHWKAILNGTEYSPSLPSSNKKAGKAQVCMVILEALGSTTTG